MAFDKSLFIFASSQDGAHRLDRSLARIHCWLSAERDKNPVSAEISHQNMPRIDEKPSGVRFQLDDKWETSV